MKLTEIVMAMTVVTGTTAIMYSACDLPQHRAAAAAVTARADCSTVGAAVVAYTADHDRPPRDLTELRDYLSGDLSGFVLVRDQVVGPGCSGPLTTSAGSG